MCQRVGGSGSEVVRRVLILPSVCLAPGHHGRVVERLSYPNPSAQLWHCLGAALVLFVCKYYSIKEDHTRMGCMLMLVKDIMVSEISLRISPSNVCRNCEYGGVCLQCETPSIEVQQTLLSSMRNYEGIPLPLCLIQTNQSEIYN